MTKTEALFMVFGVIVGMTLMLPMTQPIEAEQNETRFIREYINTSLNCEPEIVNVTKYVPVYIEQDLLYRKNTEHENHCGWYNPITRTVNLYVDRVPLYEDYLECAKHEYGHDFWNTMLSSGDRNKIEKEYKNAETFVTEYAKTNVQEYYAETYWREIWT